MSILAHSFTTTGTLILLIALVAGGCGSTGSNGDGDTSPTFSSGTIAAGSSYSFTFENEGDVEYYCELHAPNMQGQITVSSGAGATERDTVLMVGDSFQPQNLTVAPNTEVVWVNSADHDHTVVSGNPSSSSGDGDDGNY